MRVVELINKGESINVLCLGAHSDDIEIGAGGLILRWLASGVKLNIRWCLASAIGARADEARASAHSFLEGAASAEIVLGEFRDGYLPADRSHVKDWIETLKSGPDPDIILTHQREDAHQDHRLLCELTWNTFRDHLILEYEIPKWDGDLGRPNTYFALSEQQLGRKIEFLIKHFGSQRSKDWFDEETFRGLARLRGMECRARYAEAFWSRKLLLR
jgi:LmbE family N-acetylglucosaminyl deacetylase